MRIPSSSLVIMSKSLGFPTTRLNWNKADEPAKTVPADISIQMIYTMIRVTSPTILLSCSITNDNRCSVMCQRFRIIVGFVLVIPQRA